MKRWTAPVLAALAIVLGVVLFYQSASFDSRSGDDAPIYSVRRHDPYGTAALHELLIARGIEVRTLERASLEPQDHGILIQVLPLEQERYHLQTKQLVDWIAQGNTVVQLSRTTTELMRHYKIEPSTKPSTSDFQATQDYEKQGESPDNTPAAVYLARCNTAASNSDWRLLLWSPMVFADRNQPAHWQPVAELSSKAKEVVAGELRLGAGKLIIVGAPTPALNGTLSDAGNLDFLLALIGNGPVILDEWSHGVGHEATIVGFLHDAGLLPVLVQLAFLAGLFVWSTSGVLRTDDQTSARQRSSIEQVETLGYLYSRSLSADIAFNRVNAELTRRLADALRCKPAEIQAQAATLNPQLRAQFDQLYERLAQAQPPHMARCQTCGYDLANNQTGRCPECGATISQELRQRIADTPPDMGKARGVRATESERRRVRFDSALAQVLSLSYQFSREVQRERGLVR